MLFNPPAVEGAIGKRVDSENIEVMPGQKIAKFFENGRFAQSLGRDRREPQADAERRVWRDLRLDLRNVRFQARAHLVPALPRMNVRAVGEMNFSWKVREMHDRPAH